MDWPLLENQWKFDNTRFLAGHWQIWVQGCLYLLNDIGLLNWWGGKRQSFPHGKEWIDNARRGGYLKPKEDLGQSCMTMTRLVLYVVQRSGAALLLPNPRLWSGHPHQLKPVYFLQDGKQVLWPATDAQSLNRHEFPYNIQGPAKIFRSH